MARISTRALIIAATTNLFANCEEGSQPGGDELDFETSFGWEKISRLDSLSKTSLYRFWAELPWRLVLLLIPRRNGD